MADPVKNFAVATVSTTYDDAAVSIVLDSGGAAKLPDPSVDGEFNVVWWNSDTHPNPADDPNVEIVRVTGVSTETLTITRAQEGSSASTKSTGAEYKIMLSPTAKTITDLEQGRTFPFPANLTGTVAVTQDSQTVTGTSTLFLSELAVNDLVEIESGVFRELGIVNSIASDTSLGLRDFGTGFSGSGLTIRKVEVKFRMADVTNGRGLYVLDNGFVGVNTPNPRYPMEINVDGVGESARALLIADNASPYSGMILSPNGISLRFGSDLFSLQAGSFYVQATGAGFGIGDSTPQGYLEVATTKNALADVGVSSNYLGIFRYSSATNGYGAGIGFSVTNTDDNIGAALIHERVGGNSLGNLKVYTKRSATAGALPELAATFDEVGDLILEDNLKVAGNVVGGIGINFQTGTSYTLVLTDRNIMVDEANASPITLTVPPNSSVAFPVGTKVLIRQSLAGAVTITAGAGVTLETSLTLVTNGQYSVAGIVKVATDTWAVFGDLVAA